MEKVMHLDGLFVAFVPGSETLEGVSAGLGTSMDWAFENAQYPKEMRESIHTRAASKVPRWALLQALAGMKLALERPVTGERALTDRQLLAKLQRVMRDKAEYGETAEERMLVAEARRRAAGMLPGEYVVGFHRKAVWKAPKKVRSLFPGAAPKKREDVVEATGYGMGSSPWVLFHEDVTVDGLRSDLVTVFQGLPVEATAKGETILVRHEKE